MKLINAKVMESASRQIDWISCTFNDSPSPCENCMYTYKCGQENLACDRFLSYVESGSSTLTSTTEDATPSRRHFVKAFVNKNELSLSEDERTLIKKLNSQRGMNHKRIAEMFYVLPETIRKVVGAA